MPLDVEKLKSVMAASGVKQKELAARIGMAAPNVSRLLSDPGDVHLSTVERMADALGVPVGDLLCPLPTAAVIT